MSARAIALLASAASLVFAASGSASITLGTNPQRPALRVDGRGNAEVSWTAGGVRRYVFVPPTGRVYPGRRLTAADVSRASTAVAISFRRALRRTPDGRLWALQTWRVLPGGPVELRFSRWREAAPKLTLASEPRFDGERITGRATLAGRPVPLYSPTPEGKRIRSFAYIDRQMGSGWSRIAGAATRADGTFRLFVPAGKLATRYRAVLPGPNIGTTLAPDAVSAPVASSRG
ncbi:MAG: hypothetical protein WKF41_14065 [Gaiellaceae bacterium]